MVDILHQVGVKAPAPQAVYDALTTVGGLAGWWTEDTRGSGEPGGKLEFRFPPGGFDMEVIESQPSERVVWRVVDGPEEWADVPMPEDGMTGLAAVVVARRHRPQRVSVCGYLVDTFCLGVKNAIVMGHSTGGMLAPQVPIAIQIADRDSFGRGRWSRKEGYRNLTPIATGQAPEPGWSSR